MIRALIVGLGRWGQILVSSAQGNSDQIRFVAGVTRTRSKAEEFARKSGFELLDTYEEALQRDDIDAVVLATRHSQHAEQIIQAAAANKHVFVEKPFTMTRKSALEAIAACEKAGVILSVGHNRRFLPAMKDLHDLIDSGKLGQILHVEGNCSGDQGYRFQEGNWRATPAESPGGGFTGKGIHVVDSMVHLCGRISEVQAISLKQILKAGMDDTTSMLFRFESGMSGYLGTISATGNIWRMFVFGSEGWAEMREQDCLVTCFREGETTVKNYPDFNTEKAELEAFAAAVEGKAAYPMTSKEAVNVIGVMEALITSATSGKASPVPLE